MTPPLTPYGEQLLLRAAHGSFNLQEYYENTIAGKWKTLFFDEVFVVVAPHLATLDVLAVCGNGFARNLTAIVEDVKREARAAGCSSIRSCCHSPRHERLWHRLGAKTLYVVMEMEV